MKLLLNAGFGSPLGLPQLEVLRDRSFSGIRQDMLPTSSIPDLLAEIVAARMQPILLIKEIDLPFVTQVGVAIRGSGLLAPDRPAPYVEIIGEPDWAWAAAGGDGGAIGWGNYVAAAAERLRSISPRIRVIAGGITTTDRKRLDFLERAEPYLPGGAWIGWHGYRTTVPPWTPHPGFASRSDEMVRLKEIARGRRIFNTETGYHTAPSKVGGWLCQTFGIGCKTVQYTDAQVAEFARWEFDFNKAHGSDGLVWFQHRDGANPNHYEDRFGIMRQDGTWKPVADALKLAVENG